MVSVYHKDIIICYFKTSLSKIRLYDIWGNPWHTPTSVGHYIYHIHLTNNIMHTLKSLLKYLNTKLFETFFIPCIRNWWFLSKSSNKTSPLLLKNITKSLHTYIMSHTIHAYMKPATTLCTYRSHYIKKWKIL